MQISLNHCNAEIATDGIQYFGELMERVSRQALKTGEQVLRVKLNGEDLTGKDRSHLKQMPIAEIQQIEIQTGNPKILARSSLYSVADFLEKLLKELQHTAEYFRLGDSEKSNRSFVRCLDGLQVFMHTLEQCRRLLGISFELMYVPSNSESYEITVAENRRKLFEVLDGMIEAQTNQDWILLADLLEYELIPVLEDWRQIIPIILGETQTEALEPEMDQEIAQDEELCEECV
jgi:hypothetical protein